MKTNKARIQHDLEVLATYTSTPGHGVTRSSYSKEDKMAKEYLKEEMKKLGEYTEKVIAFFETT